MVLVFCSSAQSYPEDKCSNKGFTCPYFFLTTRNAGLRYNIGYVKGHKKWSTNGKIFCAAKDLKLCVLHLPERKARGEIFVEYEYLKWEKMLAAKNDCLIHQTEPEQESITGSWNQRNSSRLRSPAVGLICHWKCWLLYFLMLSNAGHLSARLFSPAEVEIEHKAGVKGCCMEFVWYGGSGEVTKCSFWSYNFYLEIQ